MFSLRSTRYLFRILLLGVALYGSTNVYAQRDSLIAIIESHLPDTQRLRAVLDLTEVMQDSTDLRWIDTGRAIIGRFRGNQSAWLQEASVKLCINEAYYYFDNNVDYELAVSMTKSCLQEAERLQNHRLIGNAYNNIGVFYFSMGRNDDCLENIEKALYHRRLDGDAGDIAMTTANMGFILFKTGLLNQSLDYLYEALTMADSIQNMYQKGIALHYLGQVYDQQGSYQRMLEIAKESLVIFSSQDDKQRLASGYNNVGSAYDKLNRLDSAMHYYEQALAIRREMGNSYGVANSLHNIGNLYFKQKDYALSLQYLHEALRTWEDMNNVEGLVTTTNHLARSYLASGNVNDALRYANQAYDLSVKQNDLNEQQESSRLKAEAYERLGQSTKALAAYKTYTELSARLFNEENTRLAEQKALSYEFDKREAAMRAEEAQKQAVLAEQLKGQRRSRNLILVALVLSVFSGALLYNRYQLKRKAEQVLVLKNKQVEAARERAEKSEAFRKRFLANMSHEIRTPMSAVIGLSRLLKDTPLNDEQDRYVHAIHHSAGNLMAVLNDILDISKIEAGKLELHPVPFSLVDELEWLEDSFLPKAIEKGLDLEVVYDEQVPDVVVGDAARLVQVLNNLLHNAIKFTERGKVILEVVSTESGVRFAVTDTGIGIAPKKISDLFNSFMQVHSEDSRRYGGTGLGLAIASELVSKMGGKLGVKSELGVGSTFHFILPLPLAGSIPSTTDLGKTVLVARPANGVRVLLAEDDAYNAIVTMETLKKYFSGITISHVQNGEMVIEKVASESFDLILMDVQMPELDGYEATRTLRERHVDTPVVALTASVIRSDVEQCYAAGMNDYIAKPFMEADFVAVVGRWLELHHNAGSDEAPMPTDVHKQTLFLQLVPDRLALLQEAIHNKNVGEISRMAHLLKPQLLDAGMGTDAFTLIENPEQADENTILEHAAQVAQHITNYIRRFKS